MSTITNRFMIALFERFDKIRYNRDLREDFFGVQACQYEEEKEIFNLLEALQRDNLKLGIHFPLRVNQWKFRDPQYLSKDEKQRMESFDFIAKEFEFVNKFNPNYVLLHYPKPVILDDRVDWTNWRFTDKSEHYYESEYSYNEFEERSRDFFKWISNKAKELNISVILELDAVNSYIYNTNLLEELLEEYSNIKLCLDIGRLHLQEKLDDNSDSYEFVKRFVKYAEIIHLWNVKVSTNLEYSHFPILPCQKPCEGWADIEKYMKIVKKNNNTCKFVFEHCSDKITDEELEECYKWIESLLM